MNSSFIDRSFIYENFSEVKGFIGSALVWTVGAKCFESLRFNALEINKLL